jgi:hypothetical protein
MPSMRAATTSERGAWIAVRILFIFQIISIVFSYRPLPPRANPKSTLQRNVLSRKQESINTNYRVTALFDSENSVVSDDILAKPTLKQLLRTPAPSKRNGIVIIAGFEAFNVQLYRKAATLVM